LFRARTSRQGRKEASKPYRAYRKMDGTKSESRAIQRARRTRPVSDLNRKKRPTAIPIAKMAEGSAAANGVAPKTASLKAIE
jgi:hypothetical protein